MAPFTRPEDGISAHRGWLPGLGQVFLRRGAKADRRMMVSRYLWLMLGLASTGCGIVGAVLPLIPTTPFLLLAAYAFARSSPRFHGWLINHPRFGPLILNWQHNGSIDPTSKRLALLVMGAALLSSWLIGLSAGVLGAQAAVLAASAIFILTRPDGPAA
jgi:uncharacterized membrane protein YbaN (DUF454 family)